MIIYEKTTGAFYPTGDLLVEYYDSGLIKAERTFVGPTKHAAGSRSFFASGQPFPDASLPPSFDGFKIFPNATETRTAEGMTYFQAVGYGRKTNFGTAYAKIPVSTENTTLGWYHWDFTGSIVHPSDDAPSFSDIGATLEELAPFGFYFNQAGRDAGYTSFDPVVTGSTYEIGRGRFARNYSVTMRGESSPGVPIVLTLYMIVKDSEFIISSRAHYGSTTESVFETARIHVPGGVVVGTP